MAELIRVGIALETSQVQQGTRDVARSLESTAQQVDRVQDRFRKLEQQMKVGNITARQAEAEYRTLRADIAELSAGANLGAESQMRLARTGQQVSTALRSVQAQANLTTRGYQRMAFGAQSMALAFEGGRVSAQGLIGSLTMLGIGSGPFLAITAGLSVIGTLLLQMGDRAEEAAAKIEAAADRARGSVGDMNDARLRGNIDRLEAKQRGTEVLPGSGIFAGGSLTAEESALLNSARAEMRRRRRSNAAAGARNRPGFDPGRVDLTETPGMKGGLITGGGPGDMLKIGTSYAIELEKMDSKTAEAVKGIASQWETLGNSIRDSLTDAFTDVLSGQKDAFANFFAFIRRELASIGARGLTNALGSAIGSAFGGGLPGVPNVPNVPVVPIASVAQGSVYFRRQFGG